MKFDLTTSDDSRWSADLQPIDDPVTVERFVGWYCRHAADGGPYVNPIGMPAVRPALDANKPVEMTRDIQLRDYEINEGRITRIKWRAAHGSTVMANNNESWYEVRCRDYVNDLDLDALNEFGKPSLPKYMKGIICGGMFLHGNPAYSVLRLLQNAAAMVRGLIAAPSLMAVRKSFSALAANNVLEVIPGVGAVDANKPIPDAATILKNNHYFAGVTSGKMIWNILSSPVPILFMYVLNSTVHYPLEWMRPWNETFLPDARTIYK